MSAEEEKKEEPTILTASTVYDAERMARREQMTCQHHWGQFIDPRTGRPMGKGCRKCGKRVKG